MTRLHEQVAFIKLEPLTPIHIASGSNIDPFDYIMQKDADQAFLYPVDIQAWVEAQPNPAELAELFASKTLQGIRTYLAKKIGPDIAIYGGAPAKVVSVEIYIKYRDELERTDSPNQLTIMPALKTPPHGALFLPGSSIKGAIRTAVIDWLDREWNLRLKNATNQDRHAYTNALEAALGKIGENAFRNLKVGDFPAALGESLIISANEVRLRPKNKPNTPKEPCEATLSQIMGSKGYAIYGKITLGAHGGGKRDTALTVSQAGRSKSWTLEELMALCNDFYTRRYRAEYNKFYKEPHLASTKKALEAVNAAFDNPPRGSMLLRLGHYSHVECMTVSNNQPQTRRLPGGSIMPSGTTRTLAHGLYPFGWARLSLVDAQEYQQAARKREEHDNAFIAKRLTAYQKIVREREDALRQKLELEQAAKEQRAAQALREAALAAMPAEERLISQVEGENCPENRAVELYTLLDGLAEPLRTGAARALKSFWQREGKWEKKKCTPKQWIKVSRVREILGD